MNIAASELGVTGVTCRDAKAKRRPSGWMGAAAAVWPGQSPPPLPLLLLLLLLLPLLLEELVLELLLD
jgi:hypothetical protein